MLLGPSVWASSVYMSMRCRLQERFVEHETVDISDTYLMTNHPNEVSLYKGCLWRFIVAEHPDPAPVRLQRLLRNGHDGPLLEIIPIHCCALENVAAVICKVVAHRVELYRRTRTQLWHVQGELEGGYSFILKSNRRRQDRKHS